MWEPEQKVNGNVYVCLHVIQPIYLFLLGKHCRTHNPQSTVRTQELYQIDYSNTGHKTPKCTLTEAFVLVVKQKPNITQMNIYVPSVSVLPAVGECLCSVLLIIIVIIICSLAKGV